MFSRDGYDILEELPATNGVRIYAARHVASGSRVRILFLPVDPTIKGLLDRLHAHFLPLKKLASPHFVRVYAIENIREAGQTGIAFTTSEFSGVSLKAHLSQNGPLTPEAFIPLALQMVSALTALHRAGLSHHGLTPGHISIDPDREQVCITDFLPSMAASLLQGPWDIPPAKPLTIPEDRLPYVSPEQTGRMKCAADHRADFYALGGIFHELLTGAPPFSGGGPMEWIHAHMAKQPEIDGAVRKKIGPALARVILKLLAKSPEDRYQSGFGLKSDLTRCRDLLNDPEAAARFEPGSRDAPEHFRLPETIYGREIEMAMLSDAFHRVREDSLGIFMVAGDAGIGKTRLVEELQNQIVESGGVFIQGAGDPLRRDIPYSGLIQAFSGFVRQILTDPPDRIAAWRSRLLSVLGENARIIVDVIPEMEFVIGKPPPPPELPPAEARNRFHAVFEKFLQVLTAKDHPLTLFVDNMQWADAASIRLMVSFFTGTRTRNFYFIGAFRDNEASDDHPLREALDVIRQKGIAVQTISLKPISEAAVRHLLADALYTDKKEVGLLAQIVHEKTRGNPFFIRRFLENLHHQGFLFYDYDLGRWQWRIEEISAQKITDNVAEFMTARISTLNTACREALTVAAVIGDGFPLPLLAEAAERPAGDVLADLREAVAMGLIVPRGDAFRRLERVGAIPSPGPNPEMTNPAIIGAERSSPDDATAFAFLHDKVREALYHEIPEPRKQDLHLRIGRLLLGHIRPVDLPGRIFAVVHHFNQAKGRLTRPEDRAEAARLNLMAGKRAQEAAAFVQAADYLNAAEECLPETAWREHYPLMFDIQKHRMTCAYLLHRFEDAEALFQVLLSRSVSDEDKAALCNQKMIMLASLARHEEVLAVGAAGLELLGVRLPERAGKLDVLNAMMGLKLRMRGKSIDSLLERPEITDARLLLTLTMMMNLCLSAYFRKPYLASCLALEIFRLTLRHGNSAVSPFAYVIYGSALAAIFREYDRGREFGDLALAAKDRFGGPRMTAKVLLYYANAIALWFQPLGTVIQLNRDGVRAARNAGDLNYAVYHIQALIFTLLAAGASLAEISGECRRYIGFVEQSRDSGALNYLKSVLQFVRCLRGETVHPLSLDDAAFSETRHLEEMREDDIKIILCRHHLLKLRLFYIMGDYAGALKEARRCGALRQYHMGTVILPEYYFFHCLTLSALYPRQNRLKQNLYRGRMLFFRNRLRHFAAQCPQNFEDKYFLVEAELAKIQGRVREAMGFYQKAVDRAKALGFSQNLAIASEAAAGFYRSLGLEAFARPLLEAALREYRRWGAETKALVLEKNFPALLTPRAAPSPQGFDLDHTAMVNALQAISTEIVVEDLLKQLMKIVMENAGARKALFLTVKGDRMVLEAENSLDAQGPVVHPSLPADSRLALFYPVLHYVKRTRTYVVMDDAAARGEFTRDPYVVKFQPKSVLCLPVIRHAALTALLYLENDITAGVFTPERIKILGLLASQAAISLENARLYENVIQNEKELREISEKREEESLRYQAQLRSLSSALSLAEERERRRIASDLHDRIGHALANASMKLRQVKAAVSGEPALKQVDEIHGLIDQSITDTQTLTFELSPPILYDLGLEAALDWLAEQTQKQHGLRVDFSDDGTDKPIEESLRVLLFQATRELLHNVVKHARATRVRISIRREKDGIRLNIADNGVGFDATRTQKDVKKGGFGIFSIQERLRHQGGRLEIKSDPETGASVTILSPLTANV